MPVKYTLPNKKPYPFSDICATLFVKSVIFYSASTCFIWSKFLIFFRLSLKSVFFMKSTTSALVANFAFADLAAKFSAVKVLHSCAVKHILLWSWLVFFF